MWISLWKTSIFELCFSPFCQNCPSLTFLTPLQSWILCFTCPLLPRPHYCLWPWGSQSDVLSIAENTELKATVQSSHDYLSNRNISLFKSSKHCINMQNWEIASPSSPHRDQCTADWRKHCLLLLFAFFLGGCCCCCFLKFRIYAEVYFNVLIILVLEYQTPP